MKNLIWKILLAIGLIFFVIPFVSGAYMMSIESWTMGNWVIMYSVIYWPTYLIGALLIVCALAKLMKKKTDKEKNNGAA